MTARSTGGINRDTSQPVVSTLLRVWVVPARTQRSSYLRWSHSQYLRQRKTRRREPPDALVWKENAAFPKGVQIVRLVGDHIKTGDVVVLRIKFPANFQKPPHTHPYSEVVTVISGKIG